VNIRNKLQCISSLMFVMATTYIHDRWFCAYSVIKSLFKTQDGAKMVMSL